MSAKRRLASPSVLAMACLAFLPDASGQETSDPVVETLDAKVNRFLEDVAVGKTQTAYKELLANSQLLKQEKGLKDLMARTDELKTRCGSYREFERIAARRVGNDLTLLHYLYKGANLPVVWYFTFYRPPPKPSDGLAKANGNWRVIAVRFDTDLQKLLQSPK